MTVDTETMRSEAVPNTSQYAPSGAGIQAAQTIASKGASVVLTGNVGPNANQSLSGPEIQIIAGATGTVREVVTRHKDGELESVTALRVMGYGTEGGMGLGMGLGGGRSMGRGRGMGIRGFPQPTYPTPPISRFCSSTDKRTGGPDAEKPDGLSA